MEEEHGSMSNDRSRKVDPANSHHHVTAWRKGSSCRWSCSEGRIARRWLRHSRWLRTSIRLRLGHLSWRNIRVLRRNAQLLCLLVQFSDATFHRASWWTASGSAIHRTERRSLGTSLRLGR